MKKNYLYHPSYSSFFCDNEQTDVGLSLNKLVRIERSIAHHNHPHWVGGMKVDETYRRNNPYWARDQRNYETRKANGFPR
jgi:hypothetical protein